MARKRRPDVAANLLIDLNNFADKHKLIDDPYINGLAIALENKKNFPMWATTDPIELLPHPEGLAGRKQLAYARYIGIFRNILVFVPVAITWEAVAKATAAFAEFVRTNNAATINFLEFWQNGYDILDKTWTISNIAQIDFAIVGLVILLSLLVSALHERGRIVRIKDRESIELERLSLALSIKLFLYSKREVNSASLNQDLATAIQDLTNATTSISKSSFQLEKAVMDFPVDTPLKREFRAFFNKLNDALKKSE